MGPANKQIPQTNAPAEAYFSAGALFMGIATCAQGSAGAFQNRRALLAQTR